MTTDVEKARALFQSGPGVLYTLFSNVVKSNKAFVADSFLSRAYASKRNDPGQPDPFDGELYDWLTKTYADSLLPESTKNNNGGRLSKLAFNTEFNRLYDVITNHGGRNSRAASNASAGSNGSYVSKHRSSRTNGRKSRKSRNGRKNRTRKNRTRKNRKNE